MTIIQKSFKWADFLFDHIWESLGVLRSTELVKHVNFLILQIQDIENRSFLARIPIRHDFLKKKKNHSLWLQT